MRKIFRLHFFKNNNVLIFGKKKKKCFRELRDQLKHGYHTISLKYLLISLQVERIYRFTMNLKHKEHDLTEITDFDKNSDVC